MLCIVKYSTSIGNIFRNRSRNVEIRNSKIVYAGFRYYINIQPSTFETVNGCYFSNGSYKGLPLRRGGPLCLPFRKIPMHDKNDMFFNQSFCLCLSNKSLCNGQKTWITGLLAFLFNL